MCYFVFLLEDNQEKAAGHQSHDASLIWAYLERVNMNEHIRMLVMLLQNMEHNRCTQFKNSRIFADCLLHERDYFIMNKISL